MAVCQLLIARGAKTDIMDGSGRVPYECADSDDVRTLLGGPDARCGCLAGRWFRSLLKGTWFGFWGLRAGGLAAGTPWGLGLLVWVWGHCLGV